MSMCNTCRVKYDNFSKLKKQLNSASGQINECSSLTTNVKSTLSSVVICGSGIDKDDTTNISKSLESINNRLNSLVSQCSMEMFNIENGCLGPSHYEKKKNQDNSNSAIKIL